MGNHRAQVERKQINLTQFPEIIERHFQWRLNP